jgi:hypothetical protein
MLQRTTLGNVSEVFMLGVNGRANDLMCLVAR